MSTAYQRGIVLLSQNRHDLAEREFRQELAADPDHAVAHAFLALCLAAGDADAKHEALHEAGEAIRLEPDRAFCHYVRGRVLSELDRLPEAEEAVNEAIRLDPEDADYLALLASIAFGRRRWSEALDAADRGLALDAEHHGCTNLRAMALTQLGRKQEATETLGSALANDPENALTHANQGWALLHQGDHVQALEHFREALRIDPELDWARVGTIEALKARHLLYRTMLRFFLWMGRQSAWAQWVVILGFIFGRKALADLAKAQPALAPWIAPILALSFAFLLLTWISSPLFNLLLRLNRFGRLALSREQRIESSWIGGGFLLAAGCFVANLVRPGPFPALGMMYFGFLLLPLSVTFGQPPGTPRRLAAAYTTVLALLGLPALSLCVLGTASPWHNVDRAVELYRYCIYGAILATWFPALTGLRTASR